MANFTRRRAAAVALAGLVLLGACSSKESGGVTAEPKSDDGTPTASDVGVTADTLTVAYVYPDLADLVKQGVVDDIAPTVEALAPLVKQVNDEGGINGRKLELRGVTWDPLKFPASLISTCTQVAEDEPNFIAISSSFFGDGASCLAGDHHVPLLTLSGMAGSLFEDISADTFLFNVTFEAAQRSAVAALDKAGKLDGLKLGAVIRDEPGGKEAVEDGLRPALKEAGHSLDEVAVIAGNGDPASLSAAVQRFKNAGVDGVFLLANISVAAGFVTEAQRQGYQPQYFGSDQSETTTAAVAKNVPPGSLDGALGVSFKRAEGKVDAADVSPEDAACAKQRAKVQPPLAEPGTVAYNGYMQVCTMFRVMVRALGDAGQNPTRASFVKAMEGQSSFDLGTGGKGGFGPDRHVAPREVRVVAFDSGCKCWAPRGDFVPFG